MITNFKKWNIILGWITFFIALITYTLTLEPTVSSWDCGEYISTSVKLQVGHPPGAPLFQMLGAFFAMFSSDISNIAYMVNFMSGLASAFTILFMFWTITNITKRMIPLFGKESESSLIAVLGSSFVGSLAYTFSDSFWFSAVEGEVYAMSSFLMALLFWLGLKWEKEIHKERGNKWLVLISFVVGLSFGVHILSLLVIPAIVMLYFFKTYKKVSVKTTLIASVLSVLILAFVFKFLFPYTLAFFSASELFFINSIGLPYNSGTLIALLLLIVGFYFGLQYTRKKGLVAINTIVVSIMFMMIGFSTYLVLPIRAEANTAINQNNPSSARELLAYYNREQYGDANVFYDKYYSYAYKREQDAQKPYRDDKPKYEKRNGKYEIVNDYENVLPNYSDKHKGFIPRMTQPASQEMYKAIAGIPQSSKRRPTFTENIKFMIEYQFGYMYGRYFMWNFVGRQNDLQGQYDRNGNWLSGIKFIDESLRGPQENLPSEVLENKGRNTYYFLPFILGIIGLLFHFRHDKKTFYTLSMFFVFTGFAIIFYTNPKPFEPRERDYAVVGSFYIFAIWIGVGVFALYQYLKEFSNKKLVASVVSLITLLAVPVLMGYQNWDDHDRSNRYTTRLNAMAYLESCDPNAILFTIGDNDTYPLWYMQEVEGIRTDIKLVNSSLFATDWYIDQMKRKTYDAPPIPSQLTHDDYKYGSLDLAYHYPIQQFKDTVIDIDYFMRWIQSKSKVTYVETDNEKFEKIYPTHKIRIPVNKENVIKSGTVKAEDADLMVDYIDIEIDKVGLTKNRIMMLDLLANNDWKRPIYFTGGSPADEEYIWLKDYLQLDGLSYKLVPIKTDMSERSMFDMGRIDTEKMYNNIMKLDWERMEPSKIYIDEQTKKNAISLRNNMIRLSEALAKEGDTIKALEILDLSIDKMPIQDFGNIQFSMGYPEIYYGLKQEEKARSAAQDLIKNVKEHLTWFSEFTERDYPSIAAEIDNYFLMYRNVVAQVDEFDSDEDFKQKVKEDFINTVKLLSHLIPLEE